MDKKHPDNLPFFRRKPTGNKESRAFSWKAGLFVLLLVVGALTVLYIMKEQEATHKDALSRADGSVPKVEEYIRQNLLADPESFVAVHWSKLQQFAAFGDTTYKVAVIYKGKNKQNKIAMYSKVFELSPHGRVVLVMDVPPMDNK